MLWKHRQGGGTDMYFLSNQENRARNEAVSFRVTDRVPELWWPDTGVIEAVPYQVKDGRTVVSLDLDPVGSVFVVFRKGGGAAAAAKPAARVKWVPAEEIAGPWDVEFPSQRIRLPKLASWTEQADEAIKHHSGAATYRVAFRVAGVPRGAPAMLDLGQVEALATVTLNGRTFPTLWKPPYRVDVSSALKQGDNALVVTVVNTWYNRLAGDAALPAEKRRTKVTMGTVGGGGLRPAGLLGPVQLLTGKRP